MLVKCTYCGKEIDKPNKEYNRQLKVTNNFFCNNSCGAKYNNAKKEMLERSNYDKDAKIDALNDKLEAAYAKIETLATKTVESASNVRYAAALEGTLKDTVSRTNSSGK